MRTELACNEDVLFSIILTGAKWETLILNKQTIITILYPLHPNNSCSNFGFTSIWEICFFCCYDIDTLASIVAELYKKISED